MTSSLNELRKTWIPSGAMKVTCKTTNAVAYVYTSKHGHACARAFRPKAKNPSFKLRFTSPEHREKYIRSFFDGIIAHQRRTKENKASRNKSHTLTKGDVLSASWGYDQTNVNFYQVLELKGKCSVVVQEICSTNIAGDTLSGDKKTAAKDQFIGKPMFKRASCDNVVKICDSIRASKWDGKPKYFSTYH